jgi:hypothetical protein
MNRSMRWAARTARALAGHIDRLRDTLELLGEGLRKTVARAVGQTVAGAAQDAIHSLLTKSPAIPGPGATSPFDRQPRDPWTDQDPGTYPTWRDGPGGCYGPTAGNDIDEYAAEPAPDSPGRRWGLALAVGCQTAAWWLRRQTGHFASVAAVGVGMAAALAAYISGPALVAAVGLSSRALSLARLIDAARAWAAAKFGIGAL